MRRKLNSTLNFIKGVLGQDAIADSIDNELHFISEDLPQVELTFWVNEALESIILNEIKKGKEVEMNEDSKTTKD